MIDDFDGAVQAAAGRVTAELAGQNDQWGTGGWTRRRFLAGVGMAGVAALGAQLVTARAAFAAAPSGTERTVVTIFLRGAADGLRIVQPMTSALGLDYLTSVRPELTLAAGQVFPVNASGFGANNALLPLQKYLTSGELAFVHGVSLPDLSRSHFEAQQLLEKGGRLTVTDGWLNRALAQMGAGTTFRAVAEGDRLPAALLGEQAALGLSSLDDFVFPGWDDIRPASQQAVTELYRGMTGPLGEDVPVAMGALATATKVRADAGPQNGAAYPSGDFGRSMKDIAAMLRTEVGLQVATVDVGGWDTHTDERNDLDGNLVDVARVLDAFLTDLGPQRRKRVTVAVMTEFGRRVAMNDSGGTDHGHGSLMWLLGGGLARSGMFGGWNGLSDAALDDGDVPGVNSPFDVLGELLQKRMGVGSLSSIFPGRTIGSLGVATTL